MEQFVAGPEVAVEGMLADGELTVLAVFDKPDPLDGPFFEETIYVTPSRLGRVRSGRRQGGHAGGHESVSGSRRVRSTPSSACGTAEPL